MIEALFLQIYDTWRYGGEVMPALIATAFVLWYTLGLRLLTLRRGDRRPVRALLRAHLESPRPGRGLVDEAAARGAHLYLTRRAAGKRLTPGLVEEAFGELHAALGSQQGLVACLIAMAPLLGLLGTVVGLIETFGSLGTSASSAASEGIAGGIVEALYATQMGLAIAVPGLLLGGYLQHIEQNLRNDLRELEAVLCAGSPP